MSIDQVISKTQTVLESELRGIVNITTVRRLSDGWEVGVEVMEKRRGWRSRVVLPGFNYYQVRLDDNLALVDYCRLEEKPGTAAETAAPAGVSSQGEAEKPKDAEPDAAGAGDLLGGAEAAGLPTTTKEAPVVEKPAGEPAQYPAAETAVIVADKPDVSAPEPEPPAGAEPEPPPAGTGEASALVLPVEVKPEPEPQAEAAPEPAPAPEPGPSGSTSPDLAETVTPAKALAGLSAPAGSESLSRATPPPSVAAAPPVSSEETLVLQALRQTPAGLTLEEIRNATGLRIARLSQVLRRMEERGTIDRSGRMIVIR